MKGTDQVFTQGMIDAGLAAHRGIDLGQQGCRQLNESDPAQKAGGSEAGQVTHHAAAQGDKDTAPLVTILQGPLPDLLYAGQLLLILAVGQNDFRDPAPLSQGIPHP